MERLILQKIEKYFFELDSISGCGIWLVLLFSETVFETYLSFCSYPYYSISLSPLRIQSRLWLIFSSFKSFNTKRVCSNIITNMRKESGFHVSEEMENTSFKF